LCVFWSSRTCLRPLVMSAPLFNSANRASLLGVALGLVEDEPSVANKSEKLGMGGGGGGGGKLTSGGGEGPDWPFVDDAPDLTARAASNFCDLRVEFQLTPVVWYCFT
jgi:hypothetical protein